MNQQISTTQNLITQCLDLAKFSQQKLQERNKNAPIPNKTRINQKLEHAETILNSLLQNKKHSKQEKEINLPLQRKLNPQPKYIIQKQKRSISVSQINNNNQSSENPENQEQNFSLQQKAQVLEDETLDLIAHSNSKSISRQNSNQKEQLFQKAVQLSEFSTEKCCQNCQNYRLENEILKREFHELQQKFHLNVQNQISKDSQNNEDYHLKLTFMTVLKNFGNVMTVIQGKIDSYFQQQNQTVEKSSHLIQQIQTGLSSILDCIEPMINQLQNYQKNTQNQPKESTPNRRNHTESEKPEKKQVSNLQKQLQELRVQQNQKDQKMSNSQFISKKKNLSQPPKQLKSGAVTPQICQKNQSKYIKNTPSSRRLQSQQSQENLKKSNCPQNLTTLQKARNDSKQQKKQQQNTQKLQPQTQLTQDQSPEKLFNSSQQSQNQQQQQHQQQQQQQMNKTNSINNFSSPQQQQLQYEQQKQQSQQFGMFCEEQNQIQIDQQQIQQKASLQNLLPHYAPAIQKDIQNTINSPQQQQEEIQQNSDDYNEQNENNNNQENNPVYKSEISDEINSIQDRIKRRWEKRREKSSEKSQLMSKSQVLLTHPSLSPVPQSQKQLNVQKSSILQEQGICQDSKQTQHNQMENISQNLLNQYQQQDTKSSQILQKYITNQEEQRFCSIKFSNVDEKQQELFNTLFNQQQQQQQQIQMQDENRNPNLPLQIPDQYLQNKQMNISPFNSNQVQLIEINDQFNDQIPQEDTNESNQKLLLQQEQHLREQWNLFSNNNNNVTNH